MTKPIFLLTILVSFTVACGNCSDPSPSQPAPGPASTSDQATLVAPAKMRTSKQMGVRGHHHGDGGQVGSE